MPREIYKRKKRKGIVQKVETTIIPDLVVNDADIQREDIMNEFWEARMRYLNTLEKMLVMGMFQVN